MRRALLFLLCACARELSLPNATPLAVSPAFATAAPRETLQLSATGGAPPYTFSLAQGGALSGSHVAITAQGLYQAGEIGSAQDLVQVRDAGGNTVEARISVGPPLSVSPQQSLIAPGGVIVFTAAGGKPPYAFSLAGDAGGAAIDPLSGRFVAGATRQAVTVTVQDSLADPLATAAATVQVGRALQLLAPGSDSLVPFGALDFIAVGGQPPYSFCFAGAAAESGACHSAAGGTIDAVTGHYSAGGGDAAHVDGDTVVATDAFAQTASLTVRTGPPLTAVLSSGEVHPAETATVRASGGAAPYSFGFDFKGNHSNGSIDPVTGVYTAGPNFGAVDTVRVGDATGKAGFVLTLPPVGTLRVPAAQTPRCFGADLNGDGKDDLVFVQTALSGEPGEIETYIQSPGHPPVLADLRLGAAPSDVIALDLNGDGRTDLVALLPSNLQLLIANPDGTLSATVAFTRAAGALQPADPLAAAGGAAFFGEPAGGVCTTAGIARVDWPSLSATCATPLPGALPIALVAGDFDGDGLADLGWIDPAALDSAQFLLSHAPASIATVPLPAGATFAQSKLYDQTLRLISADLNTDGVDDLAALVSGGAAVILGASGGTPAAQGTLLPAPLVGLRAFTPYSGAQPWLLGWDGFDGALAAADLANDTLPSPPRPAYGVDCLTTADVNGDGVPDLVTASAASTTAEVFWGDGDGRFGVRPRFEDVGSDNAAIDVDGDGAPDLVTLASGPGLQVLFNQNHQLAYGPFFALPYSILGFAAGPFLGHPAPDVIALQNGGGLALFAGQPDGTFSGPVPLAASWPAGLLDVFPAELKGAAPGPDLVLLSQDSNGYAYRAVVLPSPGQLVLGAPTAAFQADLLAAPALVDFDGDGLADLAVLSGAFTDATHFAVTLRAALAAANPEGSVTYGAWSTLYSAVSTPGMSSERLVYAGSEGARAVFATSTPSPSSGASRAIRVVSFSGGVLKASSIKLNCSLKGAVLARLDGDGNADVATVDGSNLLRVYSGDGAGGFAVPSSCAATPFTRVPGSALVALPQGNAADLLVRASSSSHNVTLMKNDGAGQFP